MPMFGTPVAASRPESMRAVRLPEGVRLAIIDMVELGDDFIAAGKRHGVKAQVMRRWLGRAECISYLRKERSRFRQSACAQNEAYLVAIRSGDNSMAAVRAIQVLEGLDEQGSLRRVGELPTPGVTIRIVNVSSPPQSIDITPKPAPIVDASDEQ
jgi:hypothetical protein